MEETYMVLPARNFDAVRLLRLPRDFEAHEAYRYVTGLIAEVEEQNPDYTWEDISSSLEEYGFETVDFILGPVLD